MSEESTAVTKKDDEGSNLTEQGKQEVRSIQQAGSLAVERQRSINTTTKQLAGMTWGSGPGTVQGSALSNATRYAIAQLCELTGANPALHLFILGGRPYLNADYWRERVAGQPHFVKDEQRNLSARHIIEIREIADQAEKDGAADEAAALRREARELARSRSHYSPPEWAQEVYETIIYRYRENAPLAAIRAGVIDGEPWIEEARECNWAGGKPPARKRDGGTYDADPVGNAEPSKTARSRSYRRCAIGAFQTTLQPIERELRRLEEAIEAEFEVIMDDQEAERASLPTRDGPQAVRIGAGEPEAAAPAKAEPLPVETASAQLPLNARKERKKYEDGCRALGIDDVQAYARDVLGREPASLEDYQKLNVQLQAEADAGESEGGEQGSLV